MSDVLSGLKDRLQTDLTAAMRARDAVRAGTIRMVLTAVRSEEVAGETARSLSDDDILTVVGREAKKRREAAKLYDDAGRQELADRERAELVVLEGYLPTQLDDAALAAIVTEHVTVAAAEGATGMAAMGRVMKAVRAQVGDQAEGGRVAAEVRKQLGAAS